MVRLLFIGSLGDKPSLAIRKLNSLNQKSGPFAMAILLSPPVHTETPPLPLPTYFAAQEHAGSDIPRVVSDNLHYIGAASCLRLYGLNIVMLSDGYDEPPASAPLPAELAVAVKSAGVHGVSFRGVDILASPIPRGMRQQSCRLAARLGWMLRPRYHAVPAVTADLHLSDAYVVKPADHGCRLVAVPPFVHGSAGKGRRWVYALDVRALDGMTDGERAATKPRVCAAVPYDEAENEQPQEQEQRSEGNDWMWDARARQHVREVGANKRQRTLPDAAAACWFCLSNEKDKHLVLHVGVHAYIALAKGGLSTAHMLIIPVQHVHGSGDTRLSKETWSEMQEYMHLMSRYFREQLNGCEPYFFERCVEPSGGDKQMHMHIQAVPLRKEVTGRVEQVQEEIAQRFGIVLQRMESLSELMQKVQTEGRRQLFWAQFAQRTTVLQQETEAVVVPLQFGRLVAASVLGQAQRYDWKVCIESGTRERTRAARVLNQLLPYLKDNK